MNLRQRKKIESVADAEYQDYKDSIDWISQFLDPIGPARLEISGEPANAWGSLMKLLFGMFPEKIELALVIVQDILLQILEAKFDKSGQSKKIGWLKKAIIGGKMIIAIGKIVKIMRSK